MGQERILKRICLRDRFQTANELRKELLEECDNEVSTKSIQRKLYAMGFYVRQPAKTTFDDPMEKV